MLQSERADMYLDAVMQIRELRARRRSEEIRQQQVVHTYPDTYL